MSRLRITSNSVEQYGPPYRYDFTVGPQSFATMLTIMGFWWLVVPSPVSNPTEEAYRILSSVIRPSVTHVP